MTQIYWIDGYLWSQWTPEQRGEYTAHLEAQGIRYGISFMPMDCEPRLSTNLQKDKDDYREEMSLGGSPFKDD
jgi:hypothetical protein